MAENTSLPNCLPTPIEDALTELRALADSFRFNEIAESDGSMNYGVYGDLWHAIDNLENAIVTHQANISFDKEKS